MPLDPRDQKNVDQLAEALTEKEKIQNKTTVLEFERYKRLFIRTPLGEIDRDEIIKLSTEFISRFNPYRPIEVCNHDGQVMFRIPQLFIPIKDVSAEYTQMVDRFRKDGTSGIPKYQAEATKGLLLAIMKSQLNVDGTEFADYGEYVRELAKSYVVDVARFEASKHQHLGESLPEDEAESSREIKSVVEEVKSPIDTMDGFSWE